MWKLDRLGRSLRDLIAMLDDLKKRGVKFRSLTEAIDTETPTGRAMWQMIGVLAELERSLISERTRAGAKAAKGRGVKFGRKPKLTLQQITHAPEADRRRPAPRGSCRFAERESHHPLPGTRRLTAAYENVLYVALSRRHKGAATAYFNACGGLGLRLGQAKDYKQMRPSAPRRR